MDYTADGAASNNPYPVKPGGFLIGIYLALALYGVHIAQLRSYFSTYRSDPWRTKLLVLWIAFLSAAQVLIIVASGYHYFVRSIGRADEVWGEFWWPLSVQDGLIPLMAFTGQLYFGRRAWLLTGRKRWFGVLVVSMAVVTLAAGVALAVTARLWANDPWVSALSFDARAIGVPSQAVAITWMGLSAATDGVLTAVLCARFVRAGWTGLTARLVALTLETVLLTHVVGGVMCVLFLTSPARARTDRDAFWALLEIVTELYALSMLFTITARRRTRRAVHPGTVTSVPSDIEMDGGGGGGGEGEDDKARGDTADDALDGSGEPAWRADALSETMLARQTRLDRQVEGYQGPTPFGVHIAWLPRLRYSSDGAGSADTSRNQTVSSSTESSAPVLSPRTPHVYDGQIAAGDWDKN